MSTTFLPFFGVIIISILISAHLIFRSHYFPFSPDSAAYIEQARNLIQEGSALFTPNGPTGTGKIPNILFPIGFPMALAFISMFGLDPRESIVRSTGLALINNRLGLFFILGSLFINLLYLLYTPTQHPSCNLHLFI
jgi:hypothetical protein